jgi:hypothetical protein
VTYFFQASQVSKHQTISDKYRALNKEKREEATSQPVARCVLPYVGASGGP